MDKTARYNRKIDDTEITGGDPDFAKITLQKPTGTEASDIDGDITVTIPSNQNAFGRIFLDAYKPFMSSFNDTVFAEKYLFYVWSAG